MVMYVRYIQAGASSSKLVLNLIKYVQIYLPYSKPYFIYPLVI